MAEVLRHLDHLYVIERAANEEFRRGGNGNAKIREVEHRAHGLAIRGQVQQAFSENTAERHAASVDADELRAIGTVIVLEGADATYPLKLDSLEQRTRHTLTAKRPMWLLLSVQPATDTQPERATVWVADAYRAKFLQIFEDYLTKFSTRAAEENWSTPEGNPANRELVANIARIRQAVLEDLWTSEGAPPTHGTHWWELWLDNDRPGVEAFQRFVEVYNLPSLPRSISIRDRTVVWVRATWEQLSVLPFTTIPIAEIRQPEFIDSIEDLPVSEQDEYVADLAARLHPAPVTAPAVTHLDTGVLQGHQLIRGSLDPADMHTVLGTDGTDMDGHGTAMAGLALLGNLDPLLVSGDDIRLEHRLESVRIIPRRGERDHDPLDYGTVTAEAVALPEIEANRSRVYCMPVSAPPDRPGEPSLWSATVDALASGTDVVRDGTQLRLLSDPDPEAARLILVAAGNVNPIQADHRTESDTSAIQDPAQAWNALTVSAHTDLADTPSDPSFWSWRPMAQAGELSPHSRTSTMFARRKWPIKPDICMEGGNVLTDGASNFHTEHPLLSLRTAGIANDAALASANATSAATAQAARLAAIAMARYPAYWPETIRGLLTHAAEWTPPMRAEIDSAGDRSGRLAALRRYGWGVPTEEAVLHSSRQAVTLVTQDQFQPFEGNDYRMRRFRLHDLPWPADALATIGEGLVRLRVTLSYFIEPSASRRGWRQKFTYASHSLRFDLQGPLETQDEFVRRVNRDAQADEEGSPRAATTSDRWLIGPNQRNLGSLHQDEWTGTGQELSAANSIAVYPVGGWWKYNRRSDRVARPVRYALIVSLQTAAEGVDLYTPIANELRIPTAILAE